MNYLNDKQLLKAIKEYIKRKTDYAILIDGAWGSGKTYFVENVLLEELKNQEKIVVYISLYGITSKKEIDEKIIEKQLEENPNCGKLLKFGYRFSNGLLNLATLNFDDANVQKVLGKINIKEILDKIAVLEDKILIFDDLERCSLPFNEILGYINEYVEHEKCKCIIVANQKEITKNNFMKNIELKYLTVKSLDSEYVSAQENEKDEISKIFQGKYKTNQSEEKKNNITKEQLNNRILELYSENLEYKQIKEKVIGRTLYYQPNMENVLKNILKDFNMQKDDKKAILFNANGIIEILESQNHMNIRTLKFAIDIFEKVIKILNNMEIKKNQEDVFEKCKINILMYIVYSCVLEKAGDKRIYWRELSEYDEISIGKLTGRYIVAFKFVDEIIDTGLIDESRINQVIKNYLDDIISSSREENNPLNLLNCYWEMEDDDILNNLEKLREQMENSNYKIKVYPKIISILVKLKHIGFNQKIIAEIYEVIEEKILQRDDSDYFYEADVNFETKEENDEYTKIINHLKQIMDVNFIENREYAMDKLLDEENWGEALAECFMKHKHDNYFGNGLLRLFNINKLIDKVISSNTRNISDFRRVMISIYRIDNIKERYSSDLDGMVRLNEAIVKELNNKEIGNTKRYNYQLIVELLSEKIDKMK